MAAAVDLPVAAVLDLPVAAALGLPVVAVLGLPVVAALGLPVAAVLDLSGVAAVLDLATVANLKTSLVDELACSLQSRRKACTCRRWMLANAQARSAAMWMVAALEDSTMFAELFLTATSDLKVLACESFVLNACTRLVE